MAQVQDCEDDPQTIHGRLGQFSQVVEDVSNRAATSPRPDGPRKRYPCPYRDSHGCERTFTASVGASQHSKIHTVVKDVPCTFPGCQKKFTRIAHMEQHRVTHFKDKPRPSGQRGQKPAPAEVRHNSSTWHSSQGPSQVECSTKPSARTRESLPRKVIAYIRASNIQEWEQERSEPCEDKGQSLPHFCVICKKQITPPDARHLHCSDHCRKIDQSSTSPATSSVPSGPKKCRKKKQKKQNRRETENKVEFVCKGDLDTGQWGCGQMFTECTALARHFRSEKGRVCIKRLVDEERRNKGLTECPVDSEEFPLKLLRQYPELVHYNWDSYLGGDNDSDHVSGHVARVGQSPKSIPIAQARPTMPIETPPQTESSTPNIEACSTCGFEESLDEFKNPSDDGTQAALPLQVREDGTTRHSRRIPLKTSYGSELIPAESTPDSPKASANFASAKTPLRSGSAAGDTYLSEEASVRGESDDSESFEGELTESDDSSTSSIISTLLDNCRRQAVGRLMVDFKALIDQSPAIRSRGSSEGSLGRSSPHHSSTDEPPAEPSCRQKRNRDESDDCGHPNDDRGDEGSKRAMLGAPSSDMARRFACPYYRRNPQNHNTHRSCAGPGWTSIHRVKEHVYRQHELPIHCPRCYTIFKADAQLTTHQRLPQGCEVRTVELPEGFTKEQEKRLRQRKKPAGSDEEKWKVMYRILFPDDDEDMIPTPYYDDQEVRSWESRREEEFDQYERYLRRELPRAVRRSLEAAVAVSAVPYESQLRGQLADIVRDAQSRLFRAYRLGSQPREDSESSVDHSNSLANEAQDQQPFFDFSALLPPSPVPESYSNPLADDMLNNTLCIGERHQQASDSGFGSSSSNLISVGTDDQAVGSIVRISGSSEKYLATDIFEEAADPDENWVTNWYLNNDFD